MTYNTIKKLLEKGNPRGLVTISKLDLFLLNNSISEEEYTELLNMLNALNE